MAKVVVTIRVMPESPEVNIEELEKKATKMINDFCHDDKAVGKVNIVPVAFGLKAIDILFVADESKGDVDPVAEQISQLDDVASAEVTDVRRAIG